jgi:hypothetical protein
LLAFERATRSATERVARARGTDLVDLAADLNGRSELFAGDRLHFNEMGSGRVAALLEKAITARQSGQPPSVSGGVGSAPALK